MLQIFSDVVEPRTLKEFKQTQYVAELWLDFVGAEYLDLNLLE